MRERIDGWKSKVSDFEKQYDINDSEAVYGKNDMVENMKKNISRLEEYFEKLKEASGAEAIRVSNTMEAYFISLNIAEHKLPLNVLQKDPKGA